MWSTGNGDGMAAALPTWFSLTPQVMEAAEVTGQQTAVWAGSLAGLWELQPPLITLPAPWLREEGDGDIFLNHPILTSEFAVGPKLNQQIC